MSTGSVILWHGQTGRQIQSIAHPPKIGTIRLPRKAQLSVVRGQLSVSAERICNAEVFSLFLVLSENDGKELETKHTLQLTTDN
jgi:hypothetical protein